MLASFIFCELMDLDFVLVHKHAEKELGHYLAILTSHLANNPYKLASLFFASLWTSTPPRSINTQNKNLANIQPSWPQKTWSVVYIYCIQVKKLAPTSSIQSYFKTFSCKGKVAVMHVDSGFLSASTEERGQAKIRWRVREIFSHVALIRPSSQGKLSSYFWITLYHRNRLTWPQHHESLYIPHVRRILLGNEAAPRRLWQHSKFSRVLQFF